MNVNPNDEQLVAFINKMAERIGQAPAWNEELGCYELDTQSWGFLAVKMHHYFFVVRNDAAGADDFNAYVETCVKWALENYRGVPRGLQKGVAIYPVLLQAQAAPEIVAITKQKPSSHWAAFALPTVVDLASGAVEFLEKTPIWGFAMWRGVRKAAQEALG